MSHNNFNYPAWYDDAIQLFRKAWQKCLNTGAARPDIGKFLENATPDLRMRLLVALVEDDYFYRSKNTSDNSRLEEYTSRRPELRKSRALLARLLRCEFDYRTAKLESADFVRYELSERFPAYPGLVAGLRSIGERPNPFPEKYYVLSLLGAGGFAEVWLAEDLQLGWFVALKSPKAGKGREQAVLALRNEVRPLAAIEHRNVIGVRDVLEAGETPYLVLKYVPGESLAKRVEREGALPWDLAARFVVDVAEGLQALHKKRIIHRDIKPDNILWDEESDEAVLTDLGIAARLGAPSGLAGTRGYVAPEAFSDSISEKSDVFSLAATLFFLVTRSLPFSPTPDNEYLRQAKRGLPDPDPRCAGMPDAIEQLIRAGLAAKPEDRLTLQEFTDRLRGYLNRLLADTLPQPLVAGEQPASVGLQLLVSRQTETGSFVPVATTHPHAEQSLRDLKRVPRRPDRATLRTGDRMRVEVTIDRPGFITVFNVGPSGNLNLLYPADTSGSYPPGLQEAHEQLLIGEVELTPPAGSERLFAVWSRVPLPIPLAELLTLVERGDSSVSRPYRATRDMTRIRQSLAQLPPSEWHAVVLELNHSAA